MNMLNNKVAVIFAASGEIAGAVAMAMAEQGANVYLSARDKPSVNMLADDIRQKGGWAEAAVVDAMDENAIDHYLKDIVAKNGKLDIVFNGIGIRPASSGYGTPTTALSFEHFMLPITVHAGSQFLTSRIAAKYMMQSKSAGTILTLTASLSRLKLPFMAGVTSACTAIEGLTRVMAAEFGSAGIKVICLNPTSLIETRTIQETMTANAATMGIPIEAFINNLSQQFLLKKSPTLQHVGEMAAFLASDAGALLNSHIVDIDFGSSSVI